MTIPTPPTPDMPRSLRVTVHTLRTGMRQTASLPPHLECAWLLLLEERFDESLQAVAESGDGSDPALCLQRLIRNLHTAQRRRPALYGALNEAMADERFNRQFRPVRADGDEWAVQFCDEDGDQHLLRHHARPRQAAEEIVRQVDLETGAGRPVLLAGLGDGHVLDCAWRKPVAAGRTDTAWGVIEPDLGLVLACLQLHEWHDEHGPIQRPNFFWVVGDHALARVERMYTEEWMMPAPLAILGDKGMVAEVGAAIQRAQSQRAENAAAATAKLASRAAAPRLRLAPGDPAQAKPRALLIHDHDDARAAELARALAGLSWEVQDLAPAADARTPQEEAILRAVADNPPDITLGIGAPAGRRPQALQDDTPLLRWAVGAAGAAAQPPAHGRDFVVNTRPLLSRPPTAAANDIWLPGVMRERCELPSTAPQRFTLALPMEAPESPRILLDRALPLCQDSHQQACITVCSRAMLRGAANGQVCVTPREVEQLVHSACPVVSEADVFQLSELLIPLADALHLLQTAEWMAMVARALHVPACFPGEGWQRYDFAAEFAQPDMDCAAAAAAAQFVLHAPRGFALDQDMLDHLAAGHFTLVRDHPSHHHLPTLAAFLSRYAPQASNGDQAAAACGGGHAHQLESLLRSARCLISRPREGEAIDPVTLCSRASHLGLLEVDGEILPSWSRLTFDCPETLEHAVRDWLASPSQRQRQMILAQECLARRMGTRRQMTHILQQVAKALAAA